MRKNIFRLWMLLAVLALASCTDNDDNPAVNPDEPQQQLADYTIMWYGHGGGNLDLMLINNTYQFYLADGDSYKNVKIAAQYKYSSLEGMQETYDIYADYVKEEFEPGTPDYEEAMKEIEIFKTFYPYADKTSRFVVDPGEAFIWGGDDDNAPTEPDMSAFLPGDNADIANPDSLANFIDWVAKTCPARKYILVLSDHGGGYLPNDELPEGAAAQARTRGVMYDDGHDSRHFTAKTLAQAISQASVRPACVYLDACLMNTAEYQFELAPTTDYLVLSTFVVPGQGGDYAEMIDALSANPDDLEAALTRFAKATVDGWDEAAEEDEEDAEGESEPAYHDMNVYRTADIDALGAEIKKFTDRLIEVYQNGDDNVRMRIDNVTAHAYRIAEEIPAYNLLDYIGRLAISLPDEFSYIWDNPVDLAFDRSIVYQQSSRWLREHNSEVDLSVLLGCNGHYTLKDESMQMRFDADGQLYIMLGDLGSEMVIPWESWGSTLDETYGQLRFDRLTGWSRWIRLNQQEPNPEYVLTYKPYETDFKLPKRKK